MFIITYFKEPLQWSWRRSPAACWWELVEDLFENLYIPSVTGQSVGVVVYTSVKKWVHTQCLQSVRKWMGEKVVGYPEPINEIAHDRSNTLLWRAFVYTWKVIVRIAKRKTTDRAYELPVWIPISLRGCTFEYLIHPWKISDTQQTIYMQHFWALKNRP